MRIDPTRYRKTFFDEAADHLAAFEGALLRLEKGPHDPDAVDEAFRAAHSVKGGADAVGLPAVARFTHALEGILAQARTQPNPLARQTLDLLLEALDILGRLLTAAKTDGPLPAALDEMVTRLTTVLAPPTEYAIRVTPHPDALRAGLDPIPLLRELIGLGEHVRTVIDALALPSLARLDPERCYLAWTVYERTTRPRTDLEAVFAFARDNLHVTIEPVEAAAPAVPVAMPSPEVARAVPQSTIRTLEPPSLERAGLIGEFCAEASDHLEAADRCLLTLDADPTDREAINAVYRGFHTIKGVSSMLGMDAVRELAHEAENLLNLARDGKVVLRGPVLELVFASVDTLKRQVEAAHTWAVDRVPLPPDASIPGLLDRLRSAASGVADGTPTHLEQPAASTAPAASLIAPPTPPGNTQSPPPASTPVPEVGGTSAKARKVVDKETVRVDKDRLDRLINTIGELVIAQSMAQQEFDQLNGSSGVLSLALPELSKISRDLQELGLSLRMVPMQGTFQKMARLVRDLARKMDKPVELTLHGEETELDKTVVDQLGDPLMHMVRNAIDHGLESPTERLALGKPVEGHITLRAYHQGGSVYIELADDGKGLDRDRILKKAIEKRIVQEGQRLTDPEIYAMIFEAGFSTAAAVTDVSGRGVGMDVVRRNVEALQGNIIIRTQIGKGTTFTIRLPLTLAIMDGLIVGLVGDVYVLPLLSVVESFRPRPSEMHRVAGRGEAVTVRGEVVPLLRLHQILRRPSRFTDPCHGLVVLVEDQGKKYALLVDELLGQMQAVVKSLDSNYQRVEGLAGATILGDGRVAMILDIHGLVQLHAQFGAGAPELVANDSNTHFGDLS